MSNRIILLLTSVAQLLSINGALTFTSVTSKHAFSSSIGTSFLSQSTITINSDTCRNENEKHFLSMKVSKGKSKQARSKGSQIALKNEERMKAAGRRGTKNFVDPNKLFVGNLSYNTTESHLKKFLLETGGVQEVNIEAVKIIRDWKTGKSKGYGFIQFVAPIFATSALESIKGKRLLGRIVRLDQGKKKAQEPMLVVKHKKEIPKTTEEEVILNALNEAESNTEENKYDELDPEAQQEVLEQGYFLDKYDDALLFDDDDDEDDDDFEYDGVYVEEFLPNENEGDEGPMNREQRREAAKKNKKRRKPGKGFGNISLTK